nr:hypothetical protein [Rhodoferax sp.]
MSAKHVLVINKLALSLVCLCATGAALAAQPVVSAPTTRPGQNTTTVAASTLPGTLDAMTAAPEVNMNTDLNFNFAGTGYCELKLTSGDGQTTVFKGTLPFTRPYAYSSTDMASNVTFKPYIATVIPLGNCKISGKGPYTANVQVNNPHPQSAGVPAKDNTVAIAGSGKLSAPVKPASSPAPVVAATIVSIALSSNTMTGAPNTKQGSAAPLAMPAGSATLLTVYGTGYCKYHLSYENLDAQGIVIPKSYPMLPKSSSAQSPFPMSLAMLNTTPAAIYRWTATGVEGCTGSANVTFTVQ